MTAEPTLSAQQRLQIRRAGERLRPEFAGQSRIIEQTPFRSVAMVASTGADTAGTPQESGHIARDRLRTPAGADSNESAMDSPAGKPSVLFLCVHNAGRSQMAAGWMRHLGGGRVDVFSGGSEPAEAVNPAAVAAMTEKGIDIGGEVPRRWADDTIRAADVVVTMGCGDECPVYPGTRYVDWELEDPAGKPIEEVRPIRDEIEQWVRGLLVELGVEPAD